MDFNYLGYVISYSVPRINYIRIFYKFQNIADNACATARKAYKQCGNAEGVVANMATLFKRDVFINSMLVPAQKYLENQKIYATNLKTLENQCISYYNSKFKEAMECFEMEYNYIEYESEGKKEYRHDRKANRTKFRGYGYNLSSQLKESAKAGAINMATGLGHSMVNVVGNAATGAASAAKKAMLYGDKENIELFEFAAYEISQYVMNKVISVIKSNTNIKFSEISEEELDASDTIRKNLAEGKIPEAQIKENVVKILKTNPTHIGVYKYTINKWGDEKGEVEKLADYFDVDIKSYKKQKLESACAQYIKPKSMVEEEVLEQKNKILDLCRIVGYPSAEFTKQLDERLKVIDENLRTVEGVMYPTRETAQKVRDDIALFNLKVEEYDFYAVDLSDEENCKKTAGFFCGLDYKYDKFTEIAQSKIDEIIKKNIGCQQLKKELSVPDGFLERFNEYADNSDAFSHMGKHARKIDFITDKKYKFPEFTEEHGMPILFCDFTSLCSWKTALILTTRAIFVFGSNGTKRIEFNDIKTIGTKNSTISIALKSGNTIDVSAALIMKTELLEKCVNDIDYVASVIAQLDRKQIEEEVRRHTDRLITEAAAAKPQKKKNQTVMKLTEEDDSREPEKVRERSKTKAAVLSVFLGCLGVDRFYLGHYISGVLKMLTFGGYLIWWLIDVILISAGVLKPKKGYYLKRNNDIPALPAAENNNAGEEMHEEKDTED